MEPTIKEEWLSQQTAEVPVVICFLLRRVAAWEAEVTERKSQVKKLMSKLTSTVAPLFANA